MTPGFLRYTCISGMCRSIPGRSGPKVMRFLFAGPFRRSFRSGPVRSGVRSDPVSRKRSVPFPKIIFDFRFPEVSIFRILKRLSFGVFEFSSFRTLAFLSFGISKFGIWEIDLETTTNRASVPWSFGCTKRRHRRTKLKPFHGVFVSGKILKNFRRTKSGSRPS